MINEIGERNYRKLLYYFNNEIWVHFKDLDGIFYNGLILELNEDKLILVLRERIKGNMPFLLEQIQEDSITPFRLTSDEDLIQMKGGKKNENV